MEAPETTSQEGGDRLDAHPSASPGGEPREPLPSLPKRILDVFFAPGQLFDALKHEPRWALVLTVGAVLLVGATVAIPTDIFVDSMRQAMLQQGGEMPEGFDPEQFGSIQKFVGAAFAGIFWYVMSFVLAGVTTFVFVFLLGDEGSYKQHLSVYAHAAMIMAIGGLLITPLKIAQGDIQATLNLGLFFPLEEGYGARFLRMLDLFWLWTFVVIGVGMHSLDRKRSVGAAVGILMIIPIGIAAVFASFGG